MLVVRSVQWSPFVRWCASVEDVQAELSRRAGQAALIDLADAAEKRPTAKYNAVLWMLEDPELPGVIATTQRALGALDDGLRARLRRLRISLVSGNGSGGLALYASGLPVAAGGEASQARDVFERIRAMDPRCLPARIFNRLGSSSVPDLLSVILMGPSCLASMSGMGRVTVRAFDEWLTQVGLLDEEFMTWAWLRAFLIRNLCEEPQGGPAPSAGAAESTLPVAASCPPAQEGLVGPVSLADLIGRLPPPLRRLPVGDLPVSTERARNALGALGSWRVEDLARLGEAHLLGRPNFGRSSLQDVRKALGRLAAKEPATVALAISMGKGRLLDVLRAQVAELPERSRVIATSRIFAPVDERKTLEELASRLGVTRERVRQMEQAVLREILQGEKLADLLDERLAAAARVRAAPLTAENLEARDPLFGGVAEAPDLLGGLLAALGCRCRLMPPRAGAPGFFSAVDVDALVSELRDALEGCPAAELERRVRDFATDRGCPELTPTILARLEPALDGPEGLLFNPRKVDTIEAVFFHAEGPLHVEEVERRLRQVGHVVAKEAVRGAVTRMAVVNVGPSTYVHATKLDAWKAYEDQVVPLLEDIMGDDGHRCWNSRELLGALSDAGVGPAETMPWFALDYLMSQHPDKFQRTGRGLWSPAGRAAVRVNAQDMAVSIVRRHGPLPLADLEDMIRRSRSLGSPFAPRPPLCRLPDGRIGHLDRDLAFAHGAQVEAFIAAVGTEIRAGQGTLDRSRVMELFRRTVPDGNGVCTQTVMFLAAHRGGLRLSRTLRTLGTPDVAHASLDSHEDTSEEAPPAAESAPTGKPIVTEEPGVDLALRSLLHSRDDWSLDELVQALQERTGTRCTRTQLKMRMRILAPGAEDGQSVDS